jgi:hypothetical protein
MRLVIVYTESDGCTYSCENVVPIVYVSGEDFLVDFEKAALANQKIFDAFTFAGQEWWAGVFFESGVYYAPSVYTVDEWFSEVENAIST